MNLRKYISMILFLAIIFIITLPTTISSASTTKYGVLIGDKENNYTLHHDLIVLSPENDVMVKAYSICKEIGLSYSYDKGTKKLTIKNKDTGKSLVFTRDSNTYIYYSSKASKGIKKTAEYKCYYDKTSKCYAIHNDTLKDLLSYTFQELDEDNDDYKKDYKSLCDEYYSQGYNALIFYNKYWKTVAETYASIFEPTDEMIKRLLSYDPSYGYLLKGYYDYHKDYDDDTHTWMYEVFREHTLLQSNEYVYTNSHLTYITKNRFYVIRFCLCTILEDSTIEEQDMDFIFDYIGISDGTEYVPTLVSVGFKNLGDKRVIK